MLLHGVTAKMMLLENFMTVQDMLKSEFKYIFDYISLLKVYLTLVCNSGEVPPYKYTAFMAIVTQFKMHETILIQF